MSLIQNFRQKNLASGHYPFLTEKDETGLEFEIVVLEKHEEYEFFESLKEMALLLLEGDAIIAWDHHEEKISRQNWIEYTPYVLHICHSNRVKLRANGTTRIAVIKTLNDETFENCFYRPEDVEVEHRGKGILDDACYRHVRLVFDKTRAPKEARLVLGEVLNYPGKWSSYPPHHHEQPEIYYYEFSPKEGYGHAENGNEVHKIFHQDLLKITNERDHSQVAAPGYHLLYIWAIRHLPGKTYDGFEFTSPYDKLLKN